MERLKILFSTKNWNIGLKTTVSHMTIAALSIVLATVLCYLFGYQYTRANVFEELERQAVAIARRESSQDFEQRASRSTVVATYQELTNSTVFFIDYEGEAVRMQRYMPKVGEADTEYSRIELFDSIDWQFIDRILAGETVTVMRNFVFAEGLIVFSGAPVYAEDKVIGGIILAQPVEIIQQIEKEFSTILMAPLIISIVLAAILSTGQTRMLVRPIQRATRVARRLADGDYGQRLKVESNDEIGELSRTINTLSLRLTQVIESLREEKESLELIITSIGEGILAVNREMQVVRCNRAFLELMELNGTEQWMQSDREDVAALRNALSAVIESGNRETAHFQNPSNRALHAIVSVLTDADGAGMGAVCLLADVSEVQRLEQLRRDYVANVSHELRTPLTGIRGMIEPLIDGYMESEEERQECYQIIQKETIRLEKLVGEMLDLSRLQDGRMTVELEMVELTAILRDSAAGMHSIAGSMGVELVVNVGDEPLLCTGNEARIKQVLVILMDNAIDFTPSGGRVEVFARESENGVVVGVRDTGCGIEPRDLPLIWERFYKADRSRMRTKGTGLGLSIAKLIVELMGGKIDVVSERGVGSEFFFTLKK